MSFNDLRQELILNKIVKQLFIIGISIIIGLGLFMHFAFAISTVCSDTTACYPLNETTGSIQFDYSGFLNNFTNSSGMSYNASGVFGSSSVQFDGSNNAYTESQNDFTGDANSFTYSLWVYPTDSATYKTAIAHYNDAGVNQRKIAVLTSFNGDGKLHLYVSNDGTDSTDIDTGLTMTLNAWTYLTVEYNTTNFLVWRNGTSEFNSTSFSLFNPTTAKLELGDTGHNHLNYKGLIDEVKVFNRTLTNAEIQLLFLNNTVQLPAIPHITQIIQPINTTYNGTSVNWNITAVDYHDNASDSHFKFTAYYTNLSSGVSYRVFNDNGFANNSFANGTITGLVDGTYSFHVNMTDNATANISSNTTIFSVEAGIHKNFIWQPLNQSYNTSNVSYNFSATDSHSIDANFRLTAFYVNLANNQAFQIYDNASYLNNTFITGNLTGLGTGTYQFFVNASDNVTQNVSINSTIFNVSIPLPLGNFTQFNTQYCADSLTQTSNMTIRYGNGSILTNISNTGCPFGCDNQTGLCNQLPLITALEAFGLAIGLIAIGLVFLTRRRA